MWYCCNVCVSAAFQDITIQSLWNDKSEKRMDLEVYDDWDKLGIAPQKALVISPCPMHRKAAEGFELPQENDEQLLELQRFFQRQRSEVGGIVDNETRRVG